MPTFTNPNNLSIVTGVPPAVHGICGNYFYDRASGEEVMMNDPKYLRAETLLAAFASRGARVAVVTAKDKLRRLLGHGQRRGARPARCPAVRGPSLAVRLQRRPERVRFRRRGKADAAVPSGPDVPVHHGLRAAQARARGTRRHRLLQDDGRLSGGAAAELHALGAIIAITADHGMNAKTDAHGAPAVIYLQDQLDAWFGATETRVILPITDPYVVHHGALGSFATIYLHGATGAAVVADRLRALPGIELVLDREAAAERFELPADRIGDLVVVSARRNVVGTSASRHDLSGLDAPLRSHGGLSEQRVPLVLNRPTPGLSPAAQLRNFDAFDVALNHTVAEIG
jgi:phosphonoacetate hydrolase